MPVGGFMREVVLKSVAAFVLVFAGFINLSLASSLSELDIIVKETVIAAQPHHPTLNGPLDFYHIGSLDFVYNHKPFQCVSMISGLVFEHHQYTSDPVMSFVVCIAKDQSGFLSGQIINLQSF